MTDHAFENTYNLSNDQLLQLDEAEELMVKALLAKRKPCFWRC